MSTSPPLAADYLYAPAPASEFAKAGYMAVGRYSRNATPADVAEAHAAGLGWFTIFETLANEALQGAAKGAADGALFASYLTQTLGQPKGTYVTFALSDFKPTAAQLPALDAYRKGFEQGVAGWLFGPYGTGYVIANLAQEPNELWWQNCMDNGPTGTGPAGQVVSGSIVQSKAALYQRLWATRPVAGISPQTRKWDEDVVVNGASIPFWMPGTSAPPPVPAPTPAPSPAPAPSSTTQATKGVRSIPMVVLMKNGEGWCASPVPADQVVSALAFDQNPAVVGRYDRLPYFTGPATQEGNGAPHGVLVFGQRASRPVVDGVYGVNVWVAE